MKLFENDLRTILIKKIQDKLDSLGLNHYIARPGGRSSIDVTLEKVNKAYAMEFLIDKINLQGQTRLGKHFGSNAIYFGDEVIVGGGNDYPVTRIPGLLVIAVNPEKELIPFLSHVFVPSSILCGPSATSEVLGELNKKAKQMLGASEKINNKSLYQESALESFKIDVFSRRIEEKIKILKTERKITSEEWQVVHAFITLMNRDDRGSRHWLSILIDELDAIMTQIAENPKSIYTEGIGTSHMDN